MTRLVQRKTHGQLWGPKTKTTNGSLFWARRCNSRTASCLTFSSVLGAPLLCELYQGMAESSWVGSTPNKHRLGLLHTQSSHTRANTKKRSKTLFSRRKLDLQFLLAVGLLCLFLLCGLYQRVVESSWVVATPNKHWSGLLRTKAGIPGPRKKFSQIGQEFAGLQILAQKEFFLANWFIARTQRNSPNQCLFGVATTQEDSTTRW